MRRLGLLVGAVVLTAVVLAGCTSASHQAVTPTTRTPTASVMSPLRRFVALAERGLRQDFEAHYLVSYGKADQSFHWSFAFQISVRPSRTVPWVAYQRSEGADTLRFYSTTALFQCLRVRDGHWNCVGPFEVNGNGLAFRSIGYEVPVFLAESITSPKWCATRCSFSHPEVAGRRLWCADDDAALWCLASNGILAFHQSGASRLRLTSFSSFVVPAAFVPPVAPSSPSRPGLPPPCNLDVCTAPPIVY